MWIKMILGSLLLLAAAPDPGAAQQIEATAKASPAGPMRCAGALVEVNAPSPEERSLVCSAANHALELLGRCGISLRRPLDVQVSNGVRHPLGRPALGFFDIVNERILIRSREVIPSLVSGTPFAAIPIGEFYESIVVHEIIHGALDQNIRWHVMGHTAGEYLAYALQIESLSPSARDTILQHVANRVNTDAFVFTDILLSMDPFFFAAQAYQHFKATSDSCATVFALLNGEAPFISARSIETCQSWDGLLARQPPLSDFRCWHKASDV